MLKELYVRDFRNINSLAFEPGSKFNFICGPNGSGKTSVLEAIYCLARAKSFRTTQLGRAIREGASGFKIKGNNDLHESVVFSKTNMDKKISLNEANLENIYQLIDFLPLVSVCADSESIINGGPTKRRSFFDSALFHVEHDYRKAWRDYHRALKQRNSAIKSNLSSSQVQVWDDVLCDTSKVIDGLRSEFSERIIERLEEKFIDEFSLPKLSFKYERGWRNEKSLREALSETFHRDRSFGFTGVGPHKANLLITYESKPVTDILSGGESKRLRYALQLALLNYLILETEKKCILLLDDMQAELDEPAIQKVLGYIGELNLQVFVTGTKKQFYKQFVEKDESVLFHVKQGQVVRA